MQQLKLNILQIQAQERLLLHLSDSEKKDLFALNAISGTHIDKYRLLSDKSTQNISIDAVDASLDALDQEELNNYLKSYYWQT